MTRSSAPALGANYYVPTRRGEAKQKSRTASVPLTDMRLFGQARPHFGGPLAMRSNISSRVGPINMNSLRLSLQNDYF